METYAITYEMYGKEVIYRDRLPSIKVAENIITRLKERNKNCSYDFKITKDSSSDYVPKKQRKFNGKNVINWDFFCMEGLLPGELVEAEIIQEFIRYTGVVTNKDGLVQINDSPFVKERENEVHPCFYTFTKIDDKTYEFNGCCFKDETKESGKYLQHTGLMADALML